MSRHDWRAGTGSSRLATARAYCSRHSRVLDALSGGDHDSLEQGVRVLGDASVRRPVLDVVSDDDLVAWCEQDTGRDILGSRQSLPSSSGRMRSPHRDGSRSRCGSWRRRALYVHWSSQDLAPRHLVRHLFINRAQSRLYPIRRHARSLKLSRTSRGNGAAPALLQPSSTRTPPSHRLQIERLRMAPRAGADQTH